MKDLGTRLHALLALLMAAAPAAPAAAQEEAAAAAVAAAPADTVQVDSADADAEAAPRPIAPDDYGQWESLGFGSLSPDGRWLTYPISRVDDEDELRIRLLEADSTITVPYGSRATFSDDGRWLAYSIGVPEDERERLRRQDKPVRTTLGVVDLRSGTRETVDAVSSFAFGAGGGYLAMRGYPIEDRESAGVDLVVRDLSNGREVNFGNVADFEWQDEGRLLAMVIDAEEKAGNGIQLYDPATGTLRVLDSQRTTYTGLTWREDEDDLAVLRVVPEEGGEDAPEDESEDEGEDVPDDEGEDAPDEETAEREEGEGVDAEAADVERPGRITYQDTTHMVLVWRDLEEGGTEPLVFDPSTAGGFPEHHRVVEFRPLRWSDDGRTVFFGVKERRWDEEEAGAAESENGEDASGDDEAPGVEVWHARDVDIIPRQKRVARRDRQENHLAAWHLDSDRFVQLGSELTEEVRLLDGQRHAVGLDNTPYERERMFGPAYEDLYLIDVATGEREKIKDRLQYILGSSPEGRYVLYLEDDHYWTYDIRSGRHTNVTEDVPTVFVDLEDDHTVPQKPPFGLAGWTEDDESVLLYDRYDVWAVEPDGSGARRLTEGAADSVRHRLVRVDPDQEHWDLDGPIYVDLYGEWTKKNGYGLLRAGRGVERLVFEDKQVGRLRKAENAPVFAYTVEDFDDSDDYFVGGPGLADARQVTETNPFQQDYLWGRSELIDFENEWGKRLQGALFYPADYDPSKTYPMIVYIYEITSPTVHSYYTPSARSAYNPAVWTAEGYFVFRPDIVYRDRNPGVSAVEALVPAVEAAVATGMIDPERVGLVGHSWGGYQTAFAVTQTDVFAAGVAGAPLTNLVSMYNSIYWNSGGTDARIFEISQGRMEVPPYEDMDSYTANSPLHNITNMSTPLLVAFGTEDGAVEFNQGVEFYNAARRAGKDMVMLVYEGENHGLAREPNQRDYHRRIMEWFGHYLKDEPAPRWISEGVPYLEQEEELKRGGGGPR